MMPKTPSVFTLLLISTLLGGSLSSLAQTPQVPQAPQVPEAKEVPEKPQQIAPTPNTTSNLITNNPFVPKSNNSLNRIPQNPLGPQGPNNKAQVLGKYLEFKSIAIINKKKYFSIFNKRTNKSFWIPENETVETLHVSSYDAISSTITISDGINSETLAIITANDNPINVASSVAQPNNNQEAVAPPVPNANKPNNNKAKAPPRRRVVPVKR